MKGGQPPVGHNPRFLLPQVIVGQNLAGIFLLKTDITRTPDPIRPTRRGFDLNRLNYERQQTKGVMT